MRVLEAALAALGNGRAECAGDNDLGCVRLSPAMVEGL